MRARPRSLRQSLVLAWALAAAPAPGLDGAAPPDPWRLGPALHLPDWLQVRGEQRTRYETLDGQFRAGGKGGDQALALRTTLLAQLTLDPARVVVEAMDSRQYLGDDGSPLDPTLVNPLDLLQAHLRLDLGEWFGAGRHTVQVGRETLDLGNRRLVSRKIGRAHV